LKISPCRGSSVFVPHYSPHGKHASGDVPHATYSFSSFYNRPQFPGFIQTAAANLVQPPLAVVPLAIYPIPLAFLVYRQAVSNGTSASFSPALCAFWGMIIVVTFIYIFIYTFFLQLGRPLCRLSIPKTVVNDFGQVRHHHATRPGNASAINLSYLASGNIQ